MYLYKNDSHVPYTIMTVMYLYKNDSHVPCHVPCRAKGPVKESYPKTMYKS